jgi:hypothetical protein
MKYRSNLLPMSLQATNLIKIMIALLLLISVTRFAHADLIEFDIDEYDDDYSDDYDPAPLPKATSSDSHPPPSSKQQHIPTTSKKNIDIVHTTNTLNTESANMFSMNALKSSVGFIVILVSIVIIHAYKKQEKRKRKEVHYQNNLRDIFLQKSINDVISSLNKILTVENIPKKYHNTALLGDGLYLIQVLKELNNVKQLLQRINNVKEGNDVLGIQMSFLKDGTYCRNNEWQDMYKNLKNNINNTSTVTIISSYYTRYCNQFIKEYEEFKLIKKTLENKLQCRKDDEVKVDGDVMHVSNGVTSIVAPPTTMLQSSSSASSITLNSPTVEKIKMELTASFPLIAPKKVELMVAEKMLDYKMKQKLEMDRRQFEFAKTQYTEQKKDERHEETKKDRKEINEKSFKLKEQEIKLNEQQHRENLEQQKSIARTEAMMRQRDYNEKEMEKLEKLKHDYMSMSFTIGMWIFCLVLCIRFKHKMIGKLYNTQHQNGNSLVGKMISNVLPPWCTYERMQLLLCGFGSLTLWNSMLFSYVAILPPMYLVYTWFGDDLLYIVLNGKGYTIWYVGMVFFCYQVVPYFFLSSRGYDIAVLGIDVLPVFVTIVFPLLFAYISFYYSLNIVCSNDDTNCKDMIFETVRNLFTIIVGDVL